MMHNPFITKWDILLVCCLQDVAESPFPGVSVHSEVSVMLEQRGDEQLLSADGSC